VSILRTAAAAAFVCWPGGFAAPPLWDMARSTTIRRTLPRSNPRPEGAWPTMAESAVNLSTPRMKISLWGPADQLTLSLGKTDVWDRRRHEWEKPLTLAEIREGTFSALAKPNEEPIVGARRSGYMLPDGRWAERYGSWRKPYPAPKPVGQVILLAPDLAGAAQPEAVVRCDDGTARVSVRRGGSMLQATYAALMSRNVIAVEVEARGLASGIALRLYRHTDTTDTGIAPPESGSSGRDFWIRQRLPAEKTFAGGFEYVLMGRVVGVPASVATTNGKTGLGTPMGIPDEERKGPFGKHLPKHDVLNGAPGSAATASVGPAPVLQFQVYIAIATSAEAASPIDEARARLDQAERSGPRGLEAENARWFRALYKKRENGRILGGNQDWERAQIPHLFRSWPTTDYGPDPDEAQLWLTSPDPARFEADETYAQLEADVSPWHGLPCLNEVYATHCAVLNQTDRLHYYAALVKHWLEASRKNARGVFGLPGMFGPAHGYLPPIKADEYFHTISSWEFCMEIPAQVMKAVWDIWDYGGDERYLAREVYPALRELAIFYAAYSTRGDDGAYHAIPAMSAEHWGWTWRFERNRDSASALSLIKWTLKSAAAAAELLARDADLRDEWLRIAGRMAPYPTAMSAEGPVYTDVAGVQPVGLRYNFFAGVTPTLLADEITLDSSPDEIRTMLRTARLVGGWTSGKVFHLLGAYPEVAKGRPPSMHFDAQPDVRIAGQTQLLGVVAREPERLLNSRSGRIHFFPCVPPGATIAFHNFQARGGFLVSAQMRKGRPANLRITSRRNVVCRFKSPWPGGQPIVRSDPAGRSFALERDSSAADSYVFTASAGQSYRIEPSR
jgi:hypothetical protein